MNKLFFLIAILFFSCTKKKQDYYLKYKVECEHCTVAYFDKYSSKEKEVRGTFTYSVHNEVGGVLTIGNLSNANAKGVIFERGRIKDEIIVKTFGEQKTISYE